MGLIIDLKPGEKILIGEAVITNDSQRARLHIAGDAPIIREKDVMQEEHGRHAVQAHLFPDPVHVSFAHARRLPQKIFQHGRGSPARLAECAFFFMQINDHIMSGTYYKALKVAKELIEHERELVDNVLKKA
jgi:flagellar protein FlbT